MINENTLLLYFYEDGLSGTEREHIAQELERDPKLQAQYVLLVEELGTLCEARTDTAPARAVARWRTALDTYIVSEADASSSWMWPFHKGFLVAAAVASVFVAGLLIGVRLADDAGSVLPIPGPVVESGTAPPVEPYQRPERPPVSAVFVRGVAAHLEHTQIQLASLNLNDVKERDQLVQTIVSQNRFFLKAADDNGAADVARLLRAFEPLLLAMTASESELNVVSRTREQLEFELDVTLTKFARQASNRTNEF